MLQHSRTPLGSPGNGAWLPFTIHYSNFTIHHGAIVARYWKRRLRTVRTIFLAKIGVSTPAKPLWIRELKGGRTEFTHLQN